MKALSAQAVAGDEDERHRALLAVFRERARQLGDDEGVVALGRARERDGAALLEAANGGRQLRLHGVLVGARRRLRVASRTGGRRGACRIRAAAARRR